MGRSVGWAIAAFGVWVLCGCTKPDPPGDLVGAYHVEGALTENTCGSDALPAANPLTFDVEIRKDDQGRGLWVRDTPPPRTGALHDDGSFEFALESAFDVNMNPSSTTEAMFERDPNPEMLLDPTAIDRSEMQSTQPCRLMIAETIQGTMLRVSSDKNHANAKATETSDAGSSAGDSDLVGENQIAIRAAAGSNCNRVLAAQSGPFLALPCRAHYDLTGTLAD